MTSATNTCHSSYAVAIKFVLITTYLQDVSGLILLTRACDGMINETQEKPVMIMSGSGVLKSGDVQTKDLTELLVERITAYHVKTYQPDQELKKKEVCLEEDEVTNFLKKAKVTFRGCSRMRRKKYLEAKRLISRRSTVFKNNKKEGKSKHIFRTTVENRVTAQLKVTKGFNVKLLVGLSGGPPGLGGGSGLSAGGHACYSQSKETCSGTSLASSREMVAEFEIPAGDVAIATEFEYEMDYEAECEFDFAIDGSHTINYVWKETNEGRPKNKLIGAATLSDFVQQLTYGDNKSDFHVHVKHLPHFEECKIDPKEVHCSHIFTNELTVLQHELEVTQQMTD